MKIKFYLLLYCSLFFYSTSNSQIADWAYRIGENGFDNSRCAIIDHAGDLLSCGDYHYRMDFDPGPDSTFSNPYTSGTHMYLTKTDISGNMIWYVSLRLDINSFAKKIVVDADNNIYLT